MFNYNVLNPVNIHYRKYPQQNENTVKNNTDEQSKSKELANSGENGGGERRFPNGNKVAIDYTQNKINISQVLQDFRSTISAINTPEEIKEEVESYLNLVGKESNKENPSRDIVLSNLKNAARITDKYIQDSLNKPSRVVQEWVDALFLQQINLKAEKNEQVETTPILANNNIQTTQNTIHTGGIKPLEEDKIEIKAAPTEQQREIIQTSPQSINFLEQEVEPIIQESTEEKKTTIEYELEKSYVENANASSAKEKEIQEKINVQPKSLYAAKSEKEDRAKDAILKAKRNYQNNGDLYSTLKLCDEALECIEGSDNINLKSAIYFERGKIFDGYDYAELALIDYHKATKSTDGNLKAQAHLKMGNIYDDYAEFDPAMDQYSRAIESSEEANNLQGKTRALRYIASMFTKQYDKENTEAFTDLAIESALETENPRTIANTYLEAANNYRYIGEDSMALKMYGALAQEETVQEDYDTLAKNYMEASMLMDKKGNRRKAYALMQKSKEFSRLARLNKIKKSA